MVLNFQHGLNNRGSQALERHVIKVTTNNPETHSFKIEYFRLFVVLFIVSIMFFTLKVCLQGFTSLFVPVEGLKTSAFYSIFNTDSTAEDRMR